MKKILILANDSSGLYNFRHELIEELLLRDCSVTTCNPDEEKKIDLEDLGCKTITARFNRRTINPINDLSLIKRYYRIIKEEKPTITITYTIKPNIYGGLVCRILKVPYSANITGLGTAFENNGLLQKLVVFLYKYALKDVKVVFFENEDNCDTFLAKRIVGHEKAKVLNGAGVNLDYFNYSDYPEDKDGFIFLFMGRIMREKGIDELILSMKRLVNEGYNCSLMMLGKYEEDYETTIKDGMAEGWLKYYGYQDDIRPFIAQSHCFILPSWHEGMANTNLECAASGRPVITSRIPGCQEAVIQNVSGFLCSPKDSESVYNSMKKMMQVSNLARKKMGIEGRLHMKNNFDKKKVVKDTMEQLQEYVY